MKIVLTDNAGNDHEIEPVILGIASDIYNLNARLKAVEEKLGISYEAVEEVVEEAEAE